ncbi:MAG: substrate-binding domain-containing protein [Marmoricola sp.]
MAAGKRSSRGNKSGRSHAASRGGGQRLLIVAIAVTSITVIAGGISLFTRGSSEPDCEAKPLTVAASSALLPVVKQGAKALNAGCKKLVAKEQSTLDVLQAPTADLPDLWIADSPAPLRQFQASGIYLKTVDPAVASSPVVLAGGPTAKAAKTWNEELSGGRVAMIDPSFNGPSAMVLTSPAAENPQITDNDLGKSFLLSAQRFGEASASGQVQVPTLTDISATTTRLFPVSEQQLMASRKINSQVTAITPAPARSC